MSLARIPSEGSELLHGIERRPKRFLLDTSPFLKFAVTFWNGVKKNVSQFEIAPWELHLRRANVPGRQ